MRSAVSSKMTGITLLLSGGVAAFLVYIALCSALPNSPLHSPFVKQLQVRAWLPEGWAFFTAPPQTGALVPYRRAADGWAPASAGPNASARNVFGLRRSARLQNVEIEALLDGVADGAWSTCQTSALDCAERLQPVAAQNTSARPTLCGDIVIVISKPVPQAWAQLPPTFYMPSEVVRLIVQC